MKTKICSNPKCKKEKPLSEFSKDKYQLDGFKIQCKPCDKVYYLENKEKINKQHKKYYEENKEKFQDYRDKNKDAINHHIKIYRKKYPWKVTFKLIKQRCENPKSSNFKYYGLKGIKCLITSEELKFLWFRDKAYLMKNTQISRRNHDKDYIFDNCTYIEKLDNVSERNRRVSSKPILQFDLDGNFIKEWQSATKAGGKMKINNMNINACCLGIQKTAYGYKWRYKNDKC